MPQAGTAKKVGDKREKRCCLPNDLVEMRQFERKTCEKPTVGQKYRQDAGGLIKNLQQKAMLRLRGQG